MKRDREKKSTVELGKNADIEETISPKGNNDFVEVDTAVPQKTCTIEHNVHDNESMISSNITLSKEKRVNVI